MTIKRFFFLCLCTALGHIYALSMEQDAHSWKKGWFEIHHINTKLGNATFFIFPDGTTLLYDAGELPWSTFSDEKKAEYCVQWTDTLSAGRKIVEYIKQVSPNPARIDYMVVSHFHDDHYGSYTLDRQKSIKGDYFLSGVTEIFEYLDVGCLIDRGYPSYDYPVNLADYYESNKSFCNYRRFVESLLAKGKTLVEGLEVGSTRQIAMRKGSNTFFEVRNLKKDLQYWSESGNKTFKGKLLLKDGKFNENPLSIALLFSYGNFRYYIGGDISGVDDWPDVDLETPLASVVGEVDAMSLHHHGYKDASNAFFLKSLNPSVIIQPSLHKPHFQKNVLLNLKEQGGDVFALNCPDNVSDELHELMEITHKDCNLHVVIRVAPGGEMFYVDTYEPTVPQREKKNIFGPYYSSQK